MSIDSDLSNFPYGKQFTEKDILFKIELEKVDLKYIDFFRERPSHLPSRKHDSIFNHCYFHYDNGRFFFDFKDNILPDYIKNDCIEACNKIFSNTTK